MVALFLCLIFTAFLARARAYVYAHTNDIIDIYLLFIIYIAKQKESRKKINAKHKDEKRRERETKKDKCQT